jgi:hypothetical protein
MNCSEVDCTLDPVWLADQQDRLLGFEILTRTLKASYQPIAPEVLSDKIGADKGLTHKIVKEIQRHLDA